MSVSNEEYLFVYGTLRRGTDNRFAQYLQKSGQWVGKGKINGRLYAIGGYPGVITSQIDGEWVVGDIYQLFHPQETYRVLDAYEGCGPDDPQPHEFSRVICPAFLDSGVWIDASIYLYRHNVAGKQSIESGDFLLFEQNQIKGF